MAIEIKSPLPGTYFHAASPEEPPFKRIGDAVEIGDVIGLVEVMKNFMEVKATDAGKVKAIMTGNGDPVTAGQVLLELED